MYIHLDDIYICIYILTRYFIICCNIIHKGDDHPLTLQALNNLACNHEKNGKMTINLIYALIMIKIMRCFR